MRTSLRLVIILVVFSGHALAAKPKKGGNAKHPVQTMDSNDPAEKEVSVKAETEAKVEVEQSEAKVAEEQQLHVDAAEVAKARDKVSVFGNVLIGFGRAPESGPANPESPKTTSATFMVGGHYDLSPQLTLGARLPWTVGSMQQNNGVYSSVQALGALELRGEYRVRLSPFTRLPFFAGLGVPIAQGNYDTTSSFRQTRLNAVADAASGYRDGELFGVKRLPVILGGGIDYERKALHLHAATKFVFGVKVGGNFPTGTIPEGTYELKSVSFRNVTSAGVAYQFLAKPALFGALDSWVTYNAIHAVEFNSAAGATTPTRLQVVFEPRVGARFGKISPSLGYIFPIGGRLADSSSSGLELHCDVAF